MGVTGLWKVLDSTGHPIKLEVLEQKVLGVDANIWLYKFIKGFRDRNDALNVDAHKIGLFRRLCKLLYYKIKPVFVFDGPAPQLKRRTLEQRQERHNKGLARAQSAALKILVEQLKNSYPGADLSKITINVPNLASHGLVAANRLGDDDLEMFRVIGPNLLDSISSSGEESDDDVIECTQAKMQPIIQPSISRKRHNSVTFSGARDQLQIDIESDDFKMLPAEVRHEILTAMKESKRRQPAYTLPDEAQTFSSLQLERLRQKRAIQEKIEEAEREICSTISGTVDVDMDDIKDKKRSIVESYRVISNSSRRMVYLKNLNEQKTTFQKNVILESGQNVEKSDEDVCEETRTKNLTPIKSSLKEYLKQEKNTDFHHICRGLTKGNRNSRVNKRKHSRDNDAGLFQGEGPNLSASSDTDEETGFKLDDTKGEEQPIVETCHDISSSSGEGSSELISIEESTEIPKEHILEDVTLIRDESKTIEEFDDMEIMSENICGETSTSEVCQQSEAKQDNTPSSAQVEPSPKEKEFIVEIDLTEHETALAEPDIVDVDSNKLKQNQTSVSEIPIGEAPHSTQNQPLLELNLTTSQTQEELKKMMNREERHANSMTDKIVRESKELLELFGVPYIVAHGEAEAQCAALELMDMTNGTITDDSDVWLFGAKAVYRHFFSDDKWVMQYKMSDIHQNLHLTRENLICMAMMVGSDYTLGLDGVGPVTALEILSEFKGDGIKPLKRFKRWLTKHQQNDNKLVRKTREHLLRLKLPDDFPSRAVYNGYLHPSADESREAFTWGQPKLDELRHYAERNFGWPESKIEELLGPVIKKLNERRIQTRIDSYFIKVPAGETVVRSKRVNAALNTMSRSAAPQRKKRKKK